MKKIIPFLVLPALLLLAEMGLTHVSSAPVDKDNKELFDPHFDPNDKYPVMVPVSSTVIPVLNLFGPRRPVGAMIPKRTSAYYLSPARRARLLERSNRPDEPVRLITKNSKQKDAKNETH